MKANAVIAEKPDIDPVFSIERVDVKTASQWLQHNVSNRKISRATVNNYAAAMQRGEWLFNGETIKFDTDGCLLDGQHRLMAIVHANLTLQLGVFRNLDKAAFKTIDTGKNRSGGDLLSLYGVKNPNAVATALRHVFFYETNQWTSRGAKWGRMSNTQLQETFDKYGDIVKSADRAMRSPLFCKMLPHSVNIFGYYMTQRVSRTKADIFFRELVDGRFSDNSDAVYTLRERLIETSNEYDKPSSKVKLCWLITAWNSFYAQKDIDRLLRIWPTYPRFVPNPLRR